MVVVVAVVVPGVVVAVTAGVACGHKVVVVEEAAGVAVAVADVVVVPALVAAVAAVAANDTPAQATTRNASALNKLEALRAALHPQPRDGKAHPGHTPHRVREHSLPSGLGTADGAPPSWLRDSAAMLPDRVRLTLGSRAPLVYRLCSQALGGFKRGVFLPGGSGRRRGGGNGVGSPMPGLWGALARL